MLPLFCQPTFDEPILHLPNLSWQKFKSLLIISIQLCSYIGWMENWYNTDTIGWPKNWSIQSYTIRYSTKNM